MSLLHPRQLLAVGIALMQGAVEIRALGRARWQERREVRLH